MSNEETIRCIISHKIRSCELTGKPVSILRELMTDNSLRLYQFSEVLEKFYPKYKLEYERDGEGVDVYIISN